MNKLERGKIKEVEEQLYNINMVVSLQYIGLKKIPTLEEIMKLNDAIAICIRQLRTFK